MARFYQTFIKNALLPDGSDLDVLRCYANDFLRLAFPGQDLSVYEVGRALPPTGGHLWP